MFPEDFDEETRWVEAQEALSEFQSYLAPHVPTLRIERAIDVNGWPRLQGVYLIYDKQDRLLYVGMTLDCFQNRIRDHERKFETPWIDLIVFPPELSFLAPALEVFLHKHLHPLHDGGGKHV
jgi:hypothetical protein